jgi:alanyl-tRNA synthetase
MPLSLSILYSLYLYFCRHVLGFRRLFLSELAETTIPTLADVYPELEANKDHILTALAEEEKRFQQTLKRGEKEFFKAVELCQSQGQDTIPGSVVFRLYDTYGFPPELTQEFAQKRGLGVDMTGFHTAFEDHQQKSRHGATDRFKGGLAERSPETIKLHTVTHLLHEALRRVLGPHVEQRGSNITVERLRFDFSHPEKLSVEQLAEVEKLVNEQIQENLPVISEKMSLEQAQEMGAIGLFQDRYGAWVNVYSIGTFSKEICGGPHVEHTSELGHFRIVRETSIGTGLRRIRAVLERAAE